MKYLYVSEGTSQESAHVKAFVEHLKVETGLNEDFIRAILL